MNLAHTLVMTELMLKMIDDPAVMGKPPTHVKEDSIMSEQHADSPATMTAPLGVSPAPSIMGSNMDGQGHPPTNSNLSVLLNPEVDTSSASVASHGAAPANTPPLNACDPAVFHQTIQDIMRLVEVFEKKPAIFEFIKTLASASPLSAKMPT